MLREFAWRAASLSARLTSCDSSPAPAAEPGCSPERCGARRVRGLWWALPVVPRGILRLPHDFDLLTVLPGGERGIVARRIRGEFGHYDLADFELVELPSGRTIKRLPNFGLPLDSFNVWKSCGSVLVRYGDKEDGSTMAPSQSAQLHAHETLCRWTGVPWRGLQAVT